MTRKEIIKFEQVEERVIELRGERVIWRGVQNFLPPPDYQVFASKVSNDKTKKKEKRRKPNASWDVFSKSFQQTSR